MSAEQLRAPCPGCGCALEDEGEVDLIGAVSALDDPEGRARLDLLVRCGECEHEFNVFVPVDELVQTMKGEARHACSPT
jgi:hypothetical protein